MRGNSCKSKKSCPKTAPNFHDLGGGNVQKKGQKQAFLAHFCPILVRSTGIEPKTQSLKAFILKGFSVLPPKCPQIKRGFFYAKNKIFLSPITSL